MATVGASHKEVQYITVLFLHEFKTSKRICTGQGLCLRITYASNQAQATHRGPGKEKGLSDRSGRLMASQYFPTPSWDFRGDAAKQVLLEATGLH